MSKFFTALLCLSVLGTSASAEQVAWGTPIPTTVTATRLDECISIVAVNHTTMYINAYTFFVFHIEGTSIPITYNHRPGDEVDILSITIPKGWISDISSCKRCR